MSKLFALQWLMALMIILTGCSQAPSAPTRPSQSPDELRAGGVLRVAILGGAPKLLHPYPEPQDNTSPLMDALTLVGSGLIDINSDTLDYWVSPDYSLATALPTISADGRTFTFTLRGDINWSDGRSITSADFQYAWDNASKPENNFVGLDDLARIESFRTPDPRTIVVTLKEPLARFLALGVAAIAVPVPRHIWEGKPWRDPSGNPEVRKPSVVSGPFIPQELSPERSTFVRRRPTSR